MVTMTNDYKDGLREKIKLQASGEPFDNDLNYVLSRLFPGEEWNRNRHMKDGKMSILL